MKINRKTKLAAEIPMSSMTDIVFLLLLFFLVTSTLVNPNALKLLLPKSTGQVSGKAGCSVSIKHHLETNTFSYHINGDLNPIPFDQIEPQVKALLATQKEPEFSIYADESVPISEVVAVMNIAKRNNYKVILATQPE